MLANHDIPDNIDILFIDGLHKNDHVRKEFDLYYPKVKPEGIIFFDDLRNIREFWESLEGNKVELKHLHSHNANSFGLMTAR